MSVRTDADEALDSARDHIKRAIDDLYGVVMEKTWGHDDFKEEWKIKHLAIFNKLVQIYVELK